MENIRMVLQRLKSTDRVEAGQGFQVARGGARWPEFPNKDKFHFKRYGCGGSASKRGYSDNPNK